jgi:transcription initiation factor IIE alpha subunit|tara:strand:- start:213 stop:629 length:417 start_codon:yes stop_codon:yes gene_type:complete
MYNHKAPPLDEIVRRNVGRSAAEVYRFLYEHSSMDTINRIYNTSNWTVKGIAGSLHMHRDTVSRAINKLLDEGYIGIAAQKHNPAGSNTIVWAIYRSDWIANVRHSIQLMGMPSEFLKMLRCKSKKVQPSEDLYSWNI